MKTLHHHSFSKKNRDLGKYRDLFLQKKRDLLINFPKKPRVTEKNEKFSKKTEINQTNLQYRLILRIYY